MPLTNMPFAPGQCLEAVEFLAGGAQQDIAWAEYYYFSDQPEKAIEKAQPYLASDDAGTRLSACLICSYAIPSTRLRPRHHRHPEDPLPEDPLRRQAHARHRV